VPRQSPGARTHTALGASPAARFPSPPLFRPSLSLSQSFSRCPQYRERARARTHARTDTDTDTDTGTDRDRHRASSRPRRRFSVAARIFSGARSVAIFDPPQEHGTRASLPWLSRAVVPTPSPVPRRRRAQLLSPVSRGSVSLPRGAGATRECRRGWVPRLLHSAHVEPQPRCR
jgi:hypothetical protein